MNAQRQLAYQRFETDLEFRARLVTLKRKSWTMRLAEHQHAEALDQFAEECYGVQRRLVWVDS